ncbi:putative leucine-rich repeat domain superfamily, F-box-like domain superfamily [Helianthus annuus]|nr:putative leucine-rich repeat domain superfamily, F-box-like domain superfamily [Helianthus annuus]
MAANRLCKEETETETKRMVDRLSCMPESLQLHILSSLDARHAIGTSVLSKSWVSSWTCIPILNFSSCSFKRLDVFDNFIANALSRRQPVKLDRLTFNRNGTCCAKILVFDYAFSHHVEELEAKVVPTMGDHERWNWPIWSSDSLTSLKLQSKYSVSWSILEPRSVAAFKNLTNLHLENVRITDLDPFSGFPALDKLRLLRCIYRTDGKILNVRALQLSEFTFFC